MSKFQVILKDDLFLIKESHTRYDELGMSTHWTFVKTSVKKKFRFIFWDIPYSSKKLLAFNNLEEAKDYIVRRLDNTLKKQIKEEGLTVFEV